MTNKIPVLLLHSTIEPVASLKPALARLSIASTDVLTCAEVRQFLVQTGPPQLIFTDVAFQDGTWKDAVRATAGAKVAAGVIVVSRFSDDPLYVAALQCGALDFIFPPFDTDEFAYVVTSAFEQLFRRRNSMAFA